MKTRVSRLEAFRRVMLGWGSEAALLADLRGNPEPPNWQMEAGTAIHAMLDDPLGTRMIAFAQDGSPYPIHEFNGHQCSTADIESILDRQGPGIRELTGRVHLNGLDIEGTCDHIRGRHVRDTKCKFSPVDIKAYEKSLQWRFYLLIHEADCFTYDLLPFSTAKGSKLLALDEIVSARFWRYRGMERDCLDWADRFQDWATNALRRAA